MLMPSQSPPSSTTTIQTLPSDQQQQKKQQDEFVDTLSSQKNNATNRLKREKSMEFDDDARFTDNLNDDINNNYSTSARIEDLNKSDSNDSLVNSSADEEAPLTISMPLSAPFLLNSKIPNPIEDLSSKRRSIRPAPNRRPLSDATHLPSLATEDSDPNVFLISSDTNSHNTIRKTKHDVKRFATYIRDNFKETQALHTIQAEKLCEYLKHYFEHTTKFDGSQYEPDTLRSFLLSIERFLKSKDYKHNLMESPIFHSCRQVIFNKREQWKKMAGTNQNNHNHHSSKNTIFSLNLKNISRFDRSKPDGLLLEMYAHVSKLFKEQPFPAGQLLWGDVILVDDQYLMLNPNKNNVHTIRLSAIPEDQSKCPVHAYRIYATHRPPLFNGPESFFFLMPRATAAQHIWYKTSAAGKNLEQVLKTAIQNLTIPKQSSNLSSIGHHIKRNDRSPPLSLIDSYSNIPIFNGKRNESRLSLSSCLPLAKRLHTSNNNTQPLNLSLSFSNPIHEDDSGTASSSPCNSLSNEITSYPSLIGKTSSSSVDTLQKTSILSVNTPIWDESVTEILLNVAKQHDTRIAKINILRSYLEEKLGVVEFLCLYRGFKSEPKLTFHATPWEHYQRFLPVLFTLLALDNTTV